MVGILIGIAAVVSLIGLGEGLRVAVISQFSLLSTDILSVQAAGTGNGPPGAGVINPLFESYVNDIEKINGVEIALGRKIESAKISFNGKTDFAFAGSMPDGERRKETERIAQYETEKGRMLKDKERGKVVLGNNYRKPDRFGKPIDLRDDIFVNGKKYEVVGFLEKKGSFIVDNLILINEDDMTDLFNIGDTYSVIAVKVVNGNDMGLVKERIEKYLRKERDVDKGEEDFTVESPEQGLKDLDATLLAIQIFVYVVAAISIIIGGIGIANTMYTSVLERTKQIGIMKSIGAKRSDIFTIFLIESGLLGMVGGILGIAVGSGIAYGMAYLGRILLNTSLINVKISPVILTGTLVFSFVIGSVAGILPAMQAANLKPVDALRHAK